MAVVAEPHESNRLARAFALLFGAHVAGLVAPLLAIPWLARVLGPAGWAPLLVAQSLAAWAILMLEFGFDLAGTRAVAQAASPELLAREAARVQRARFLLTPAVSAFTLITALLVPAKLGMLVPWTVLFVVARGLSPYWFFQGTQRLRLATTAETLGKVLPVGAFFLLVREPGDAWKAMALQALGAVLATGLQTARLHRTVQLPQVSSAEALRALRGAVPMFGARAASGLYLQANTLILSMMAPAAAVAVYGSAERLVRAAINLLTPVTQAFFPHVSRLVASDPDEAHAAVKRSLLTLGGLGVLGALGGVVLAPLLVRVLLGGQYEDAVPVLRVLLAVIPLVAVGTVLGIYWALPWRREWLFMATVCAGGAVNVALAMLLVPRMQAMGMSLSVVTAELVVMVTLGVAFARSRK